MKQSPQCAMPFRFDYFRPRAGAAPLKRGGDVLGVWSNGIISAPARGRLR